MVDQPLGPVIHIIGHEAIVKPHKSFVAKGATVVTTSNQLVGKLDYPVGRVDLPYQVIKLHKKAPEDLKGQFLIAKIGDKSKNKKKRNFKKKRQ